MDRTHYLPAELVERVDFSPDHMMVRFRLNGTLTFLPGQYATIAIEDGEKVYQRPYSIVSSPLESLLEFFIELVPDGDLTPRLWQLKVGERILIRNKAAGKLNLVEMDGFRNHLMIATVTGAAPFVSIARTQAIEVRRGKPATHRLVLIHGASRAADLGTYKDELSKLAREDWFSYTATISRPWEDEEWSGETGRVEDVLRKHAGDLGLNHTNTIGYVCGHPQMILNVKDMFRRARFPDERINEEKFFALHDQQAADR